MGVETVIDRPHFFLVFPPRSAGYTQKRLTENLKVPYYVGEQFSKEFSGVILKNLERSVEDDYISNLRNNCWKEKQQSTCVLRQNKSFLWSECGLNLSLLLWVFGNLFVCFFSCRRRNALQSTVFWRHWPVPKSAEGTHTKLRQTVWDHSFPSWLRPRAKKCRCVRQLHSFDEKNKKQTNSNFITSMLPPPPYCL